MFGNGLGTFTEAILPPPATQRVLQLGRSAFFEVAVGMNPRIKHAQPFVSVPIQLQTTDTIHTSASASPVPPPELFHRELHYLVELLQVGEHRRVQQRGHARELTALCESPA
jgi:hypothetical protein